MNELSQGERFVFEWQYRMAGGFNETLALAFGKADGTNFNKLRKGFPEEGEAMWNFANTSGWWEEVQRKAGR
ncbi:MAG: hypothetical protein KAI79_18565 [Bacteroidales bacterium]|nr:hypothetical protein [Bacteroidales bacterium]